MHASSQTLREAGHAGIAVEHYAWDRAKYTALARLSKAHHNRAEFPAKDGVPKYMMDLTEFVVQCHVFALRVFALRVFL